MNTEHQVFIASGKHCTEIHYIRTVYSHLPACDSLIKSRLP